MTTTKFQFKDDCTTGTTWHTDNLPQPKALLTIYDTLGLHNHNTHLLYIHQNHRIYSRIFEANFEVPRHENELTIVLRWRSSTWEDITLSRDSGVHRTDNTDEQVTHFTFTAPPYPQQETWNLDGGLPGFHLTVKVKRK